MKKYFLSIAAMASGIAAIPFSASARTAVELVFPIGGGASCPGLNYVDQDPLAALLYPDDNPGDPGDLFPTSQMASAVREMVDYALYDDMPRKKDDPYYSIEYFMLDTNCDDIITRDEFLARARQRLDNFADFSERQLEDYIKAAENNFTSYIKKEHDTNKTRAKDFFEIMEEIKLHNENLSLYTAYIEPLKSNFTHYQELMKKFLERTLADLEHNFAIYDQNGDGYLSEDEIPLYPY